MSRMSGCMSFLRTASHVIKTNESARQLLVAPHPLLSAYPFMSALRRTRSQPLAPCTAAIAPGSQTYSPCSRSAAPCRGRCRRAFRADAAPAGDMGVDAAARCRFMRELLAHTPVDRRDRVHPLLGKDPAMTLRCPSLQAGFSHQRELPRRREQSSPST